MHRAMLVLAALSLSITYSELAAAQNTFPKAQPPLADTESRNQSVDRSETDRIETARKLYDRGLALIETRQLAEAADAFHQALQLEPEFAEAYAALGRTYFKMREWQKALDNLNRAAFLKSKQRAAATPAPNPYVTQTKASRPKRADISQQNTNPVVGIDPAQSGNAAATSAPLKAFNQYSLSRKNAEIVSSNESTSATINLRNLLPLESESSNEQQTEATLASASIEETPLTQIYRVGANDVLDIRLNDGPEQQSTLYTVTSAGLLEHPVLNEPMPVVGLTVEEIASRIEADLRRRAIVENAKALVAVSGYASHSVLVSGLAKESGTKFLRREAIPLYVVIADAQPFPEAARVSVVRGGERSETYDIDLNRVADMDFLVRSGDVVTLHPDPTQFIYIGGEIKSPGEKTFRRGLTLMQVILASGGLDPNAKIAQIAHADEQGFLVSTRFKLKEILAGKAADPELKPGDRISILR